MTDNPKKNMHTNIRVFKCWDKNLWRYPFAIVIKIFMVVVNPKNPHTNILVFKYGPYVIHNIMYKLLFIVDIYKDANIGRHKYVKWKCEM